MAKPGNPYHDPETGEFTTAEHGVKHSLATRTANHIKNAVVEHGVAIAAAAAVVGISALREGSGGALRSGIQQVAGHIAARKYHPYAAPVAEFAAGVAFDRAVAKHKANIRETFSISKDMLMHQRQHRQGS